MAGGFCIASRFVPSPSCLEHLEPRKETRRASSRSRSGFRELLLLLLLLVESCQEALHRPGPTRYLSSLK
jgi:hypothetical protein